MRKGWNGSRPPYAKGRTGSCSSTSWTSTASLRGSDLLVITADHGNDPSTPSTDHSREYVPALFTGSQVKRGADIGTRRTFADLGQTLAANFGVGPLAHGTSFLEDIVVHHP